MTWQGDGGAGAPGGPDDETITEWLANSANVTSPPPGEQPPGDLPPAPPLPPTAPTIPTSMAGQGGYLYPAQLADATPPGPPPGSVPPPAGGYPPPAGGYPPQGSYPPPPGGTWAPPVAAGPGPAGLKFGGVLPRLLAYWLDGFLTTIIAVVLGMVIGVAIGATGGSAGEAGIIGGVLAFGIQLLYFVGFWTGGSRATPGMRLFNLQLGRAADGVPLTVGQAVLRWVALGAPLGALSLLPGLAGIGGLLAVVWSLVLLLTTLGSDSRQGLHDKIAGSTMVAPVGREGPVMPCLVLVVILFVVLPIFSIVALIFLGGAVSNILTNVGTSI